MQGRPERRSVSTARCSNPYVLPGNGAVVARAASQRTATLVALTALVALAACGSTVDRLGSEPLDAGVKVEAGLDDGGEDGGEGGADAGVMPPTLTPLTGPSEYPNLFRDLLGKTEQEITDKIDAAYQQLFAGDPGTEAIYYQLDATHAEIRDIYHGGDVRTEGIGYAMLINVELANFAPDSEKKEVFDNLWRQAKVANAATGANSGYFVSVCDTADGDKVPCVDPFGYQQFTMALIFAHDLWGSDGAIDYEADALALLDVMLNKQEQNMGIVDDVLNTFDAETKLVFDEPNVSASGYTRPSVEMPAYYDLWAQATGDAFFREAAAAGRAYLERVAHPTTGLVPVRATFSGQPLNDWGTFAPEAYRTHLNVTLDHIWSGTAPWPTIECDRLLGFFAGLGIDTYGGTFELDGTAVDRTRDDSLVFANGIAAVPATLPERRAFVQAVWDMSPRVGPLRYYAGLFDLLALLTLSGRMQVI
jgi:oligosaccharide reducing-end xylanase